MGAYNKDNPSKAGIIMHGREGGEQQMIVSCNQGRFSTHGHHLVLCKGSIDKGETPLRAALREFHEEGGPDLAAYLGEANIALLERGVTLRHVTNPALPGTEILSFKATPNKHIYHARKGNVHGMWMYDVCVAGIEHFPLKNPKNITTQQLIRDDKARPKFPIFYQWLDQGFIPAEKSRPEPGETIARKKLFDEDGWFARQIRKYAPHGRIETREDWQEFCETMEKQGDKYDTLRHAFGLIKKRLTKQGWIEGDSAILKFDEKDCPMHYYAEGSYRGSARYILTKVLMDMKENYDYGRAFGGQDTELKGLSPEEKMLLGQMAAFFPVMREKDIRGALRDAYGPRHPVNSHANEIISRTGRHRQTSFREAIGARQPSGSARTH